MAAFLQTLVYVNIMKKTKEETAQTRAKILKGALVVFSRKGYAAARLEDVAREIGMTRGAIYWHFKNKIGLYETLLSENYLWYNTKIKQTLEGNGSPVVIIRRLLRESLVYLEKDEEYRAVQEILILKTELAEELHIQKRVVHHNRMLQDSLIGLIRGGIDQGQINPGVNPELGALALVSYLIGLKVTWLVDPNAFSLAEKADELIDFFMAKMSCEG